MPITTNTTSTVESAIQEAAAIAKSGWEHEEDVCIKMDIVRERDYKH